MFRSRYVLFAADLLVLVLLNLPLGNHPALTVVIPVLMIIGVYAFRAYDIEVLASGRNTLYRVLPGALLGLIPLYLSYPFILGGVRAITIPYNILLCAFSLGVIHKIIYRFFLHSLPVSRLLPLGICNGLMSTLRELSSRTFSKLEFTEPCGDLEPAHFGERYDGVLILDSEVETRLSGELAELKSQGVPITYLPHLCETYLKRIPIEVIERNPSYYRLSFEGSRDEPLTRFLDIVVSILLLIVLFPAVLITGLLIMIENGLPIRFSQIRIGRFEMPFVMHKLRTLRECDADRDNPNCNIEKRSLRIGRILRKTRLDEVFQLANVIKGEMSIVGPRPEMPQFHERARHSIPFYTYRLRAKPGITGWAQLCYKHTSSMQDYKIKTEYDLYYIKNRTILMDLKVMLKTFETMIGLRGR